MDGFAAANRERKSCKITHRMLLANKFFRSISLFDLFACAARIAEKCSLELLETTRANSQTRATRFKFNELKWKARKRELYQK